MIAKRIIHNGTEIYNRDRDLKTGRFSSFKSKLARITKKTIVISGIISTLGWYGLGMYHLGVGDTKTIEIIKEVKAESGLPAVLQRIARCESGNKHYDKSGQVVMRANKNGTIDLGIMQINSIHFTEATRLGLDLTKESDNIAYAKILYETRGTEDWYPSKACWNK
jgi:hypothetical protein